MTGEEKRIGLQVAAEEEMSGLDRRPHGSDRYDSACYPAGSVLFVPFTR